MITRWPQPETVQPLSQPTTNEGHDNDLEIRAVQKS